MYELLENSSYWSPVSINTVAKEISSYYIWNIYKHFFSIIYELTIKANMLIIT